jgi:hypothetical protein
MENSLSIVINQKKNLTRDGVKILNNLIKKKLNIAYFVYAPNYLKIFYLILILTTQRCYQKLHFKLHQIIIALDDFIFYHIPCAVTIVLYQKKWKFLKNFLNQKISVKFLSWYLRVLTAAHGQKYSQNKFRELSLIKINISQHKQIKNSPNLIVPP